MSASDDIPKRKLGKTDVEVSALALGGHHLGDAPSYEQAERIVHEAIDLGVTFFDNCWEYHNGRAENWMGRALAGRRERVFLMTKVCVHGRGKEVALRMLEESLRRLGTDHVDLWQLHGVAFENEPAQYQAKGGAFEALTQAKQGGKTRFVGFTGHKSPTLHLQMLATGYPFDAVQLPLNAFDAQFRSFEKHVLPELAKRGIAALGMKPMNGNADAVKAGALTAEEALRYAMSLPVATTISGMESLAVLRKNAKVARGFKPLSKDEMAQIRAKVAAVAGDGRFELYKLSLKFDNPEAREQHGFPLDLAQKELKEEVDQAQGKPQPI